MNTQEQAIKAMETIKDYCASFDGCKGCVFNVNNRCSLTDGNVMNPSEWEV